LLDGSETGVYAEPEFPLESTMDSTIARWSTAALLGLLVASSVFAAQDPSPYLAEPRYLGDYQPLQFSEPDPAAIIPTIRVTAGRTNAAFGFNTPEVVTYLPALANSHYARFEFSNTELIDTTGRSVPFADNRGYDETTFAMDYRFENEDYQGYPRFARARGSITVHYPVTVRTLTITVDDEDAQVEHGLLLDGPFVYDLDRDDGRAAWDGNLDRPGPLRAFDADGRQLRRAAHSDFERTELGFASVRAFYGAIARLELDIIERSAVIDIAYDLPPAPELAMTQAGTALATPFPDLPGASVAISLREVTGAARAISERDTLTTPSMPPDPAPTAAHPADEYAHMRPARPARTPPDTNGMSRPAALAALAQLGLDEIHDDAFLEAVATDNLDASALFLAAGFAPDRLNEDGMSPAMLAAMMGHADIMLAMLDAGADANGRDIAGLTPLLRFARECHASDVVARLLAAGADANAEVPPGMRPLVMAQTMNCTDNQRLLRAAGAR